LKKNIQQVSNAIAEDGGIEIRSPFVVLFGVHFALVYFFGLFCFGVHFALVYFRCLIWFISLL